MFSVEYCHNEANTQTGILEPTMVPVPSSRAHAVIHDWHKI